MAKQCPKCGAGASVGRFEGGKLVKRQPGDEFPPGEGHSTWWLFCRRCGHRWLLCDHCKAIVDGHELPFTCPGCGRFWNLAAAPKRSETTQGAKKVA